jgi:Protein of unknown function (DUF3667)
MSKKVYRKDKTCLNCRHVVENKFCPNCGQENSDTRKTFHHLFVHFFEDLTHYENAFWKTIKNLLFRPSNLTKEYLSGKRLSYLAPVRLYIFISFIAFFIISLFPDKLGINQIIKENKKQDTENLNEKIVDTSDNYTNKYYDYNKVQDSINKLEVKDQKNNVEDLEIQKILKSNELSKATKDTLIQLIKESSKMQDKKLKNFKIFNKYSTLEQLDSVQKFGKPSDKLNVLEYWFAEKALHVVKNNTKDELFVKGIESAKHNFPKVLLLYMPFFAFFLWIFHGKKRWYYFDHGIFTLHYFSFLLLLYLIIFVTTRFLEMFVDNSLTSFLQGATYVLGFGWMFYYFFPAHHRFYGESRWISFIKSYFLFIINMFFILLFMSFFFVYTLLTIH